jgi:hypothetical protein
MHKNFQNETLKNSVQISNENDNNNEEILN